jgi:hypothetical protein
MVALDLHSQNFNLMKTHLFTPKGFVRTRMTLGLRKGLAWGIFDSSDCSVSHMEISSWTSGDV